MDGKTYIKVGSSLFESEDGEIVSSFTLFPLFPQTPEKANGKLRLYVANNRRELTPVTTYAVTRRLSSDFCEGDSYVMPQLSGHGYTILHQKIVGIQVMEDMILIESVPMPIQKGFYPIVTKFAILKDDTLIPYANC